MCAGSFAVCMWNCSSFIHFTHRIYRPCLIMIPMSLGVQRLYMAYFCVECFLGSDDEDARKSAVGRRELSQVRLKEVNHSYDLDVLTLAVTIISQTSVEHICVISLFFCMFFFVSFKSLTLVGMSFSLRSSLCLKK